MIFEEEEKKIISINKEDSKIVFMGTPEFAKTSLEALIKNDYNVVAVFCQPDKPKGRGLKLSKPPVKECAEAHGIPVYQPETLKKNYEVTDILMGIRPDFIIVVAYGKILPVKILDMPKYGCINVHASRLPEYRGAAPIQWCLINGEADTGATTMYMDEGMDTGKTLIKERIFIDKEDNYETLYNKLRIVGASVLISTLNMLYEDYNSLPGFEQEGKVTMAPMITKEMTKIDFNKSALNVFNLIRALYPTPGAYMTHQDGRIFKVFKSDYLTKEEFIEKYTIEVDINIKAGTVVISNAKQGLVVATGDGFIELIEIQEQNFKKMDAKEYLKGKKIDIDTLFI